MVPFRGQNGSVYRVFVPLVLVLLGDAKPLLKKKACSVPDLPAHSIYQCQPPLCQESLDHDLFGSGTVLEFFCQPGYILASQPALSICQGGQWSWVRDVVCKPQGTSVAPPQDGLLTAASIPIIAGAALTLLAFLVIVQLCALLRLKSRPLVCRCHSGQYEIFENSDVMEHVGESDAAYQSDRSVAPLPSYEEAVCSHVGDPLQPSVCGPRPLVFSDRVLTQPESHSAAGETPDSPPPSYQEALAMAVESRPGGQQPRQGTAQDSFPLPELEDGP